MSTGLDLAEFRRALAQFPTGVTVVSTTHADGSRVGLTASSFNTVSMQPPLILWSVARNTYCAGVFESAKCFVINVLGKHQVDISNGFASPVAERFSGVDHRQARCGCPVIADTAAWFECRTWNRYDGGDHMIVVGEVRDFQYSDAVMPLVFSRGSYAVSVPQPPADTHADRALPEDGFLSNYLLYQLHRIYGSYSAELYPLLMTEFGVSPEEWRILTILADVGSIDLGSLSRLVSQPLKECRDCLIRLQRRGYLTVAGDSTVRIDGPGAQLTSQLIAFAKQHEQTVFGCLPAARQQPLSNSLKTLLDAFAR